MLTLANLGLEGVAREAGTMTVADAKAWLEKAFARFPLVPGKEARNNGGLDAGMGGESLDNVGENGVGQGLAAGGQDAGEKADPLLVQWVIQQLLRYTGREALKELVEKLRGRAFGLEGSANEVVETEGWGAHGGPKPISPEG
jgi:hypothetical protein